MPPLPSRSSSSKRSATAGGIWGAMSEVGPVAGRSLARPRRRRSCRFQAGTLALGSDIRQRAPCFRLGARVPECTHMDPSQWMAGFRVTHEKAKAKQLSEDEFKKYLGMREELARSLIQAQSLQVPEGQNSRKYFRVAQMYKVEIAKTYNTM